MYSFSLKKIDYFLKKFKNSLAIFFIVLRKINIKKISINKIFNNKISIIFKKIHKKHFQFFSQRIFKKNDINFF